METGDVQQPGTCCPRDDDEADDGGKEADNWATSGQASGGKDYEAAAKISKTEKA